MSQRQRLRGRVNWFSHQRRYGFVTPDIGGEDIFIHYSNVHSEATYLLVSGNTVEFSVEKGENGRMKAVDVTEAPYIPYVPKEFGRGGGRSWGRNGRAVGGPCYNCGQNGHLARDCTRSYQGGAGEVGPCFKCGQLGHLARDCKQASGSNSRPFAGSCYNCGQIGHLARDCEQEKSNIVNFSIRGYSGGGRGCYNCGEPGHLARDCPNYDDN